MKTDFIQSNKKKKWIFFKEKKDVVQSWNYRMICNYEFNSIQLQKQLPSHIPATQKMPQW
jgi:hypothetical protein